MTTLLSSLTVLALIDSTSLGTLLIPLWFLMTSQRVRVDRFFIYLFTVVGLYFVAGLVIMFGADVLLTRYAAWLDSTAFLIGQLVLGIGFMVISQLMDSKKARARAKERAARGEGRMLRMRQRLMGDSVTSQGSLSMVIGLALTAVILEIGTMLPYLAAMGIIASEEIAWPLSGVLLLGYCLVMILPALVLLAGRLLAYRALEKPLARIDNWFMKHAQSTTAWIIGIVGFLLTVNAIYDLGWVG
ncbi:GAP family protein [Paenibacillus daejeonensis]|uniref:GAP family protein n=1 Tax=Paenibacillus daejeonensis TaxID=135193 RepID=UPI000686E434|nr:GAP family protein [Paenibacillus daejeonensis]